MELNEITGQIVDAAIKIHKELGPGLLESVYEEVLTYELTKRGFLVERQIPVPVYYEGKKMKVGFRIDVFVEKTVIVEIKSCELVTSLHKKKVNGYLRLTGLEVALIINFNVELLKSGITRIIRRQIG